MRNIYHGLSKLGFLSKHYTSKFLFVAFLGIHVPLIVLVIFICTGVISMSPISIILLTLVATLIATAITLLSLRGALWPLHLANKALRLYLNKKRLPLLPIHYTDEAGLLLARIQETIEKLDVLIEEKKDLISLFSHDMRTPTSQVITLATLMKDENDPVKIKEFGHLMEQVATRQMDMLNDVLFLLSEDYVDDYEKSFRQISVKELLTECTERLELTASQKNIAFNLSIDQLECQLKGDKTMLMEAFSNVLTNAIKFSHPSGIITVQATSLECSCRIEIIDTGVGFDNINSKKLFEKFTKHGKSGTAGEQSTGIGLYLTKNIIHKHNGKIEAFSNGLETGARFTIEIPCQ